MEEYCTHIAIMSHGTIMQFGTVREISAGVDDGRCRYTVQLAAPVPRVAETIAAIDGVSRVHVESLEVTLEYGADRAHAAELLRELVRAGVPVSGFTVNAAGLEEAYLRAGIRQVD
jgi:ABC-type multidrug transport system ATPase subunit